MSIKLNNAKALENKGHSAIRERYELPLTCLLFVGIIIISSCIRFRSGEIDFLNSDATWHVLYTIECYDETPISQHLFLPIVSMGGDDNKWISWGACIPGNSGNYYYTSFSPAGFFLPWLFMKLLHLPLAESSLYIFNTFLFAISVIVLILLLRNVYADSKHGKYIVFSGALTYVFAPELLHGMGICYWHQSIMQVTLLIQIYAYYMYAIKGLRSYQYIFYAFTLINPYIEWTGYVANVGFALAELIINRKKSEKIGLAKPFTIGITSIVSFGIFCGHYLLRTETTTFFTALRERFMVRSTITNVMITDVIGGYYKSFLYLWVALLVFIIWTFIKNGSINIKHGILFLVTAFPVIENIVMKQHAFAYTYDRMKAVFVMVLLLCEVLRNILDDTSLKMTRFIAIGIVAFSSFLNLISYKLDEHYIWDVDYRTTNEVIADYVTTNYPDAIYASDTEIRGYMNLLFMRGIYELQSIDSASEKATEKGKSQVVYIRKDGYRLQPILIKDVKTEEIKAVYLQNGKPVELILDDG